MMNETNSSTTETTTTTSDNADNLNQPSTSVEFVDDDLQNISFIPSDPVSETSFETAYDTFWTPKRGSTSAHNLTVRPDSPIARHLSPTRLSKRSYWSTSDSYYTGTRDRQCSRTITSKSTTTSESKSWESLRETSHLLMFGKPLEPLWETEGMTKTEGKNSKLHMKTESKSSDGRSEIFGFCCSCVNGTREDDEQKKSLSMCTS